MSGHFNKALICKLVCSDQVIGGQCYYKCLLGLGMAELDLKQDNLHTVTLHGIIVSEQEEITTLRGRRRQQKLKSNLEI